MDKSTVEIKKIIFKNEDYNICKVNYSNTDAFFAPSDIIIINYRNLTVNDVLEIEHQQQNNTEHGKYEQVITAKRVITKNIKIMEQYLNKFVSKLLTKRILEKYGLDSIEKIKDGTIDIKSLTGKKLEKLRNELAFEENYDKIYSHFSHMLDIEQLEYLTNKFSYQDIINNPFVIVDLYNISFQKAEEIASYLDFDNVKERNKAYVLYNVSFKTIKEGNTFIYKQDESIKDYTYLLQELQEEQKIKIEEDRVYLSYYNYLEKNVSKLLKERLEEKIICKDLSFKIMDYEIEKGIELNYNQQKAVENSYNQNISILTGGPGTGKTQTIDGIINILKSENKTFTLLAPTGKAAKRVTELTGEQASTIHKKLNILPFEEDKLEELEEIIENYVIIDESSMLDLDLFNKVLIATRTHESKIILVGDKDQLSSVSTGNVFKDLLEIVSVVELNKVYRQSENSHIAMNAKAIREYEDITIDNKNTEDFYFLNTSDSLKYTEKLLEKIKENIVLVYTNKEVREYNQLLQNILNPRSLMKKEYELFNSTRVFREGDKVMQTKNNYELNVFNGETGVIKTIQNEAILVEYDDRDITYSEEEIKELVLAYAITIHKSQGSEYKNVLIPITKQNEMLYNKNLIYTAITRAKEKVVLFGDLETLKTSIKKDEMVRNSHLVNRLKEN